MARNPKGISVLALRLLAGLALLGWPRVDAAQGTWSALSLPQKPSEILYPLALAVDGESNLFVAEALDDSGAGNSRIQKRDAQGNWSVIATGGTDLGQVFSPMALAVDTAGNLFVAEWYHNRNSYPYFYIVRIQKRDAQGNWSEITPAVLGPGGYFLPMALAVDTAGNLFVAEVLRDGFTRTYLGSRIQKRDAQGNWSEYAYFHGRLVVDAADNLFVADYGIQKRDAQGNWSILADEGTDVGQVSLAIGLAVDTAGNLYVADFDNSGNGRIQKRDAQGGWSVITPYGSALGQVSLSASSGLATDAGRNLYVADTGNHRVLKYTPGP